MDAIAPAPKAERPAHVPPGLVVDFDVHAPAHAEAGFHTAWKRFQDEAPGDVVWTPRNSGHWIVTRGPGVRAVFQQAADFSSKVIFVPKEVGELHTLPPGALDPPEHTRFRNVLNEGMSLRNIPALEATIRELCTSLVEGLQPKGGCEFVTEFAELMPVHLFMHLFDAPLEDAPKLKFWTDQITKPGTAVMSVEEATNRWRDYLSPLLEARMDGQGDDMISRMVAANPKDRPMSKVELLDLAVQIFSAGLDTVVNFLTFTFHHLATHPEQRRDLVADPDKLPRALEELFRRFPLVTIGRLVTHDMPFQGVELKAGDMIVTPSALHGLDDRENPDPLTVDFNRPSPQHTTFGAGHHRCPGAPLARVEMRIVVAEWLKRIPEFSVAPGAEVTHQGGVVGSIRELPLVW